MSMIEKVGAAIGDHVHWAIKESFRDVLNRGLGPSNLDPDKTALAIDIMLQALARAAIEAMREPTEAMTVGPLPAGPPSAIYAAMIQAALEGEG